MIYNLFKDDNDVINLAKLLLKRVYGCDFNVSKKVFSKSTYYLCMYLNINGIDIKPFIYCMMHSCYLENLNITDILDMYWIYQDYHLFQCGRLYNILIFDKSFKVINSIDFYRTDDLDIPDTLKDRINSFLLLLNR